jgi:hypothetical protein
MVEASLGFREGDADLYLVFHRHICTLSIFQVRKVLKESATTYIVIQRHSGRKYQQETRELSPRPLSSSYPWPPDLSMLKATLALQVWVVEEGLQARHSWLLQLLHSVLSQGTQKCLLHISLGLVYLLKLRKPQRYFLDVWSWANCLTTVSPIPTL